MRFDVLLMSALLVAPVAAAQSTAPAPPQTSASSNTVDSASPELPVSLAHIRAGLKKDARDSILSKAEIPADFRVHVIEQGKIDDLLSKLNFKDVKAPAPAGGLYGYEQQRLVFNPIDHPLVQPYAAFSGSQLITIAIENLIGRYLAGKAISAVSDAERTQAERAAREDVTREIADYCATRPDRASIVICNAPPDR